MIPAMSDAKKTSISGLGAKRLISYAGTLLMIVSLVFIGRRLMTYGIDFSLLRSPPVVFGLILISLIEGMGIIFASLNYRALIKNVSGVVALRPLAMVVYTASNLYKYIPGGVMYVVGRNRLAVETEGLSHAKVAFATVTEGVLAVLGALIIAVIFTMGNFLNFVGRIDVFPRAFSIGLAVTAVIAVLGYLYGDRLSFKMKKFWSTVEILKLRVIAKRLGFGIALMFLYGMTFVATTVLLGQPMTAQLALTLSGLYLLAWLAGFMTPGAPSGLGIREAVMIMFASGLIVESILLSAMVIHRIIIMAGDVAAYGFSMGYAKLDKAVAAEG